jgi:hypothetical protein
VERANGIISDTLHTFPNGCKDDWDGYLPMANNTTPVETPAHYAERMRGMEATVRESAAQAEQKVRLDAGRVDTVFQLGDQVLLLTKELLDVADISQLRPRRDGPFTVTACPSPNAYTLALPRKMRCSPTVNVDRLKPFHTRAGAAPAPGPVSDAGQEGQHEVELLLHGREILGVTRHAVTWCDGGGTRHRTTSGCGLRTCRTARIRWQSTTPRHPTAAQHPGPSPPARRRRWSSRPQLRRRRPSAPPPVSGSRLRRRFWRALPLSARRCSTAGRWRAGSAVR